MAAFSKSLRQKALGRIQTSQRLAAAHANRPRRWPHWIVIAVGLIGGLELAIVLPLLVPVSTFFVLGPIATEVWDGKHLEYRPPAGIALAAQVHFIGGILALTLAGCGRSLFCRGISRLAYFPHRDFEGVRRSDRTWLFAMSLVAIWCFLVWRYAATYQRVPLTHMLLLVPLAVAQAWMIYATAVVAVGLIRPALRLADVMATWIFTSMGGYGLCLMTMGWPKKLPPLLDGRFPWPQQPPAWLESLATLSGLLLPTGWVDAVVWYGVLQGQAWGWLFLLPCAALSALALWCRPRLVSLREIRVSSQGQLTPVFDDDPEPEAVAPPAAITVAASGARPQPATEAAPSLPHAADRQAILKRLHSCPPLGKADWSAGWPLERLLGRLLTERERVLVEDSSGGFNLTLSWLIAATAVTIGAPVAVVAKLVWPDSEGPPLLICSLAPVVGLLVALPGAAHTHRLCHTVTHPVLPVGFREMTVAGMKVALFRLLCGMPLMVLPLAAIAAFVPVSSDMVLGPLIGTCAGIIAWYVAAPGFAFANHTRYEFSFHRLAYLVVFALLFFSSVLMGPIMILAPNWPVTLVLACVVLTCAAIIWRYFDWLYHSGHLDYVDWRPLGNENR